MSPVDKLKAAAETAKVLAEQLGWVVITHEEYNRLKREAGNAAMGAWHRQRATSEAPQPPSPSPPPELRHRQG